MKTIFTILCTILITTSYALSSEGRIEISQSMIPLTITNAESYIVTQPLTGKNGFSGITIAADNVAIDLNGFDLAGVTGSLSGIIISGNRANIIIKNGSIHNWGGRGIDMLTASNSVLKELQISNNGNGGIQIGATSRIIDSLTLENSGDGINVGNSCILTRCISKNNTGNGIITGNNCNINQCTTRTNGSDGFNIGSSSSITGASSRDNSGDGIQAGVSSLITECTAFSNSGNGITATNGGCKINSSVIYENSNYGVEIADGALISSCAIKLNSYGGIYASSNCYILRNNCNNHTGTGVAGILVDGSGSRIESNHSTDNEVGIKVNTAGNIIVKNSTTGNATEYSIATGNNFEEQIDPGSSFSTKSWINFQF